MASFPPEQATWPAAPDIFTAASVAKQPLLLEGDSIVHH